MSEAIVHVGMHKTGTTSIQRVFGRHRPRLLEQGFLFPAFAQNHFDIHTAFTSEPFKSTMVRARGLKTQGEIDAIREGVLASVEAEIRDHPDAKLLLVAEDLSTLDSAGTGRFRAWLDAAGVGRTTIHIYLRDPISFWESLIQQSIKGGHQIDFAREARGLTRVRAYRPLLEAFAGAFGQENVRPHIFAADRLLGGDVVRDFADKIGLDIEGMELVRANESLSRDAMLFLNEMNRRVDTYGDHGRSLLRDGLLQAARTHKGEKFKADLAIAQRIIERSAEDRAYLAETWFDGDDPFIEQMQRRIGELEAAPASETGLDHYELGSAFEVMTHVYRQLKEENLRLAADRFRLKSVLKRNADDPKRAEEFMEKSKRLKRELAALEGGD